MSQQANQQNQQNGVFQNQTNQQISFGKNENAKVFDVQAQKLKNEVHKIQEEIQKQATKNHKLSGGLFKNLKTDQAASSNSIEQTFQKINNLANTEKKKFKLNKIIEIPWKKIAQSAESKKDLKLSLNLPDEYNGKSIKLIQLNKFRPKIKPLLKKLTPKNYSIDFS